MIFSYNWLQSFFGKKLPRPDKLAEVLTMHSFEIEEMKKTNKDLVLDIDVLSNRAYDCLCYIGMAREIAAILGKKSSINYDSLRRTKLKIEKDKLRPIILKTQCPQLVPRYSAIVVKDVKVQQSPQWLKQSLKAVGINSINNIVDITNYVMLETGQPLHAFDYDKIQEQKMILRQSKKGEKIITLDGAERVLDKGMLVIRDKGRLIDLVGIMGGELSEIDTKTKNIVLQAGNFNRRTIYLTSKKLAHSTEASNIYTHGIDPNLTLVSLERVYFLLKKLSGGKIVQIIDNYPKKVLPKMVKLEWDYIEKLLGRKIPRKVITKVFNSLEFKIKRTSNKDILLEIPTFRQDVSIPEDVIEEIARIYGYEKIEPNLPSSVLIPPEKNESIFWINKTRDILKGIGFSEAYNYSFNSQKQSEIFGFSNLVEVENPVSVDQRYLRNCLVPNLLKNVESNFKNFDAIKIFEIGKTFSARNKEKNMLCGVIARENNKQGFYEIKGVIDSMLNQLGISDVWYDEYKPSPENSNMEIWEQGKCAEIKVGGKEIGFLGEISSSILAESEIKIKPVVFDIDFEELMKQCSEEQIYQPVSRYPSSVRDLAVLVPMSARVVDVLNKINNVGGALIVDVDLFDIYEGRELPEDKKNFAFHIVYQSKTRTLLAKEVDAIQEKIIKSLESDPAWEVRK